MKKINALLLATLCSTALYAQTRLTSIHYYLSDGTTYINYANMDITYKAGNNNVGGDMDFSQNTLKCDEHTSESYDATHGLYPYEQTLFEYDAKWNNVKKTTKRPDPAITGPFANYTQQLIEYDNNNNQILLLEFLWNKTLSSWDSTDRKSSTFDANSNRTFYYWEKYNTSTGFYGYSKKHYLYDANNNLLNTVNEQYLASIQACDTIDQQLYHYNANQEVDTTVTQTFNRSTRQWVNKNRYIYSYTNGWVSHSVSQIWASGQWRNQNQTFTTQNAGTIVNNNESWSVVTNVWEKMTKDSLYTISTSPKVTEKISYSWTANKYQQYIKRTDAYNTNNYKTLTVAKSWDAQNNTWYVKTSDDSIVYKYEQLPPAGASNLTVNTTPEVTLYPNPTNGNNITLQVSTTGAYTIAIYNLQGALMAQQYVADDAQQKTIPVAHLANGQYILTVKSNEGNATRMFNISR